MGRRMKVVVISLLLTALGGLSLFLVTGFAGAEDRPTVPVARVASPESLKAPEPVVIENSNEKPDKSKEKAQPKNDKPKSDDGDEKQQKEIEKERVKKEVAKRPPRREAPRLMRRVRVTKPVPADTTLSLTVPKMGLYDNPVINTSDPAVLDNGAVKLPQTGFPWQPGANTYIAAHVLGYAGTGSYMQFSGLPNMTYGDEILLTDANGTTYTYRVTEVMTVTPYDTWVMNPVPGKTMVTLQTCINPPAYDQRLIVRGELVG